MSTKLSSLVKAADDPAVLLYVINNLGKGVPNHACFAPTVQSMRVEAMRSLASGQWQMNRMRNNHLKEIWTRKQFELIEDQIMPALMEQQEKQLTAMLFQQASLNLFLDKLVSEKPSMLQKQLKNDNLLIRLVAISAVERRHLHFEEDLIELLDEAHPAVQAAARKALIGVARGTDFGPIPGASHKSIARSIEKWRHWLALQQSASPEAITKDAAIGAAGKRAKVPPLEIVPLILVGDEQSAASLPKEQQGRRR